MFFCLGNICRSPIAEGLFRAKVEERGWNDFFKIDSSGTSGYHSGELPDPGSIQVMMERRNYDITYQRSQKLSNEHVRDFDYLIAMDQSNLSNAQHLGEGNFIKLRDFDPQGKGDVPDPWGNGGKMFSTVYDIIDRSLDVFLDTFEDKLGL